MLTGKETSKTTRKVKIPKVRAKEGQNELKSTNPADSERKSSMHSGPYSGGRGGQGALPKGMVPNRFSASRFSASRKGDSRQNSPKNGAESFQAMLPEQVVHTPLLISRKSKRRQNLLSEKAKSPEAMVSKRLLASCSLVLLDLGKPTAAHCDCRSTYTEQPQLLWMWANECGPHAKFGSSEI